MLTHRGCRAGAPQCGGRLRTGDDRQVGNGHGEVAEASSLICLSESRSRSRSAYSLSQETRSAAVAAFSAHRHCRMSDPRRNVPEGRLQ
jgi:hypothetical protein